MTRDLLDLLRCPLCGGTFSVAEASPAEWSHAVIACACGAYPVVDGIPVLKVGDEASASVRAIGQGECAEARRLVLGLPATWQDAFDQALGAGATFAGAAHALLPGREGDRQVLRFGDPAFLVADAVVRVIARRIPEATGRLLDVCGGCGHLSWTLSQVARERRWPRPVLLDASFLKLSLARRFVAPEAALVCADASQPLPFASGAATLAVCHDAAHEVRGKRMLATDMMRVAGPRGWVAWTHVAHLRGGRADAGATLAPAHYASLFAERAVLAASDGGLLAAVMGGHALPWGAPEAAALAEADAVALVAAPHGGDLMLPAHAPVLGQGHVVRHPWYVETRDGDRAAWQLARPAPAYDEEEAEAVMRYLPERLEWQADEIADLRALASQRPDLLARRILLQVPETYL